MTQAEIERARRTSRGKICTMNFVGMTWISINIRTVQIMEVIIRADAALESAGKGSLLRSAVAAEIERLEVGLRSCRITSKISRLGGNVRLQVVFESDHFLQTPTYSTRLSQPKFPNSMYSNSFLPSALSVSFHSTKSSLKKDFRKYIIKSRY
jgi:hypothetical protein